MECVQVQDQLITPPSRGHSRKGTCDRRSSLRRCVGRVTLVFTHTQIVIQLDETRLPAQKSIQTTTDTSLMPLAASGRCCHLSYLVVTTGCRVGFKTQTWLKRMPLPNSAEFRLGLQTCICHRARTRAPWHEWQAIVVHAGSGSRSFCHPQDCTCGASGRALPWP